MTKTIAAFLAVATIAGSIAGAPAPAHGAIASSRPAYGGPVYVEGPPPPPPGCYWTRQRFWDGYGWQVRPVQVCN